MRIWIGSAFLGCVVAAACGKPAAPPTSLSVVQGGRRISFSSSDRDQIEALAIELLYTCNVEARKRIANALEWDRIRQGAHVRLVFDPPRSLGVIAAERDTGDGVIAVDEMMIPMTEKSYPDNVWIKNGDSIRAFTKMSPGPSFEIQALLKAAMDRLASEERRPIG